MDMRAKKQNRRYTILGSTGSVGQATLDMLRRHDDAADHIEALVANTNVKTLIAQALEFRPKCAVIGDESKLPELKAGLSGTGVEVSAGRNAVLEAAQRPVDWVMSAIVGVAGLMPTLAAIENGSTIALANKESLVCAGPLVMKAAKRAGAHIIPVDSEHSAVFQTLDMNNKNRIHNITLTASGGPFLRWSSDDMAAVTPAQACKHPNWSMGAKISVDSATMMNKGLEVIEAAMLFDLPAEQIDVLVHPQSVVHSLVSYTDGSTLAHMSPPDMRVPISYALGYPERINWPAAALSLAELSQLTFEEPDTTRFPLLDMARSCLSMGQGISCILNAANEVAVQSFLTGQIGFLDIQRVVAEVVDYGLSKNLDNNHELDTILAIDDMARRWAYSAIVALGGGRRLSVDAKQSERV